MSLRFQSAVAPDAIWLGAGDTVLGSDINLIPFNLVISLLRTTSYLGGRRFTGGLLRGYSLCCANKKRTVRSHNSGENLVLPCFVEFIMASSSLVHKPPLTLGAIQNRIARVGGVV